MVSFRAMISNSTSTSIPPGKFALLFLLLISQGCRIGSNATGKSTSQHQQGANTDTVYSRCTSQVCSLFTISKFGKEVFIDEGSWSTTVRRVADHIYGIHSSCGSPCSNDLFYSTATERRGGFYPDVIATDTNHLLIARLEYDTIVVECMFHCDRKPDYFTPAFSPVAAYVSAVREARFQGDKLFLTYATGNNYEDKVDSFSISDALFSHPH